VKPGASTAIDRDALARQLLRDDRIDGIAGSRDSQFPNGYVHYFYSRSHIELAKLFAAAHQVSLARIELARSLVDYSDPTTKLVLRFSGQQGESLDHVVAVIEAL
jgi:hypothetical protein